MRFRPCIDIHNGKVKQIVGGSLADQGDQAVENFVSGQDAAFFAKLYQKLGLTGGHVILLNPASSEYYEETKKQALLALAAYPGGLQAGGGISPDNAVEFLNAGADKVIVTSYVFQNGVLTWDRLRELVRKTGRERLVLDLSCRKKGDFYYIVTNRWQNYTDVRVEEQTLAELSDYCSEFLIHAVDVEGKAEGIERELVKILGEHSPIPTTYAGGIHNFQDLEELRLFGKGRVDATIGSALDLFGGRMRLEEVLNYMDTE